MDSDDSSEGSTCSTVCYSVASTLDLSFFTWMCHLCQCCPVNPNQLWTQFHESGNVVLIDGDGAGWVRCDGCDTCYHTECWRHIQGKISNRYICCEYDWLHTNTGPGRGPPTPLFGSCLLALLIYVSPLVCVSLDVQEAKEGEVLRERRQGGT